MTQTIKLTDLRLDGGTQARVEIDSETVLTYAEAMRDGAVFPPVVAFRDDSGCWLADGFHRVEATRLAGRVEIAADLQQGGSREARLYAAGANALHGLRRTRADKRRAVELCLADSEWAQRSDRDIAKHCAVSHTFVAIVRALAGNVATGELQIERAARTLAEAMPDVLRYIAECKSIKELKQLHDLAVTMQKDAVEVCLSSERRIGELLREWYASGKTLADLNKRLRATGGQSLEGRLTGEVAP